MTVLVNEAVTDEAARTPTLDGCIGRPGPPPLRIHHLMAAMAVAATLLSLHHLLRQNDALGISRMMQTGQGVVITISTAISATLVGFGVAWRRAGRTFFDQPGHWLLLGQTLGVVLYVLAGVVAMMGAKPHDTSYYVAMGVYAAVVLLGWIVLSFLAAWRIADSVPWRLIFLMDGATLPCLYGFSIMGWQFLATATVWGAPVATLLMLLIAGLNDRRARRPRDWAHWVGVFMRIAAGVTVLGQFLWQWLATNSWSG